MKLRYYNFIAGMIMLMSCEKQLPEVAAPDFGVSTENLTYQAGAPVTFSFTGDPNLISFYSGEPLKEYAYRNGRTVDATGAGAIISFQTAVVGGAQGTLSATVPPQLSVMASTNFNGNYDFASVQAATWTDITARFRYGLSATFFASTPVTTPASPGVSITDLLVPGKPLYIAYKYKTNPQAVSGLARQWQIQTFVVRSNKDIGNAIFPNIADQANAGFQIIDQNLATTPSRSATTSTRLTLWSNLYDPLEPQVDPASEIWGVSRAMSADQINLGPDLSAPIKNYVTSKVFNFVYTYTKPGTYKATFVATNNTLSETKEIVREVVITVTP